MWLVSEDAGSLMLEGLVGVALVGLAVAAEESGDVEIVDVGGGYYRVIAKNPIPMVEMVFLRSSANKLKNAYLWMIGVLQSHGENSEEFDRAWEAFYRVGMRLKKHRLRAQGKGW